MLMIGKQLTAVQRLDKALMDILSRDYFVALSGVLITVQHQIVSATAAPKDQVKTACTNGVWAKYGAEFVDGLTDAELRFLILHETYHCMYQHLTVWDWMYKIDGSLANQACDHVINLQLLDAAEKLRHESALAGNAADVFLSMPEGGCADPQFTGMDSGEVFNKLLDKQEEEQEGGEGEKGEKGGAQGEGEGQGGFDEHDWEGAAELSDEEKAENARQMEEAVRQGALLASKTGSGGARVLGDMLQTKVRWQDALREYLQATCAGNEFSTWRKPNRRFVASGIYMPSGISEIMGELVVAIDMSGSIGPQQIAQFMGEIVGICDTVKPETVRLLYWDTQVCQDEKYAREEQATLVETTKPAGGGGTSPSCITDHMRSESIKPQVVVVLTDGYVGGDWGGEWPCPVLWCIVGNKSAVPAVGSAIHVEWNN